jgi:hypothetical protein
MQQIYIFFEACKNKRVNVKSSEFKWKETVDILKVQITYLREDIYEKKVKIW